MKIYFFLLFVALLVPQFVNALPSRSRNEPDCSQYEDGDTLPDSSSCSKYYMCVNGKALRKHCARGLYYDAMAGVCNRAFLVNCELNRLGRDIIQDIPNFNLGIELDFGEDSAQPQAVTTAPCITTTCSTTTTCTTTSSTCTTTTCSTSTTTTCTTTTTTKTTTTKTTTTKTTTTPTTTTTTCTTPTTTTTTCTTPTTTTTTCTTPTTTTTACATTPTTTTTCTTTTTTTKTTTTKTTTTKTTTTKTTTTTTCTTPTTTKADCATTPTTITTCATTKTTTCPTTKTTTCPTTKSTTCPTTKSTTCTTTPTCTTTTTCAPPKESITSHKAEPLKYLSSSKDCLNLPDDTILLDFNHCRRYYKCLNRRVKRKLCSVGYWYDQETRSCRQRGSVTNCMANRN